MAENDDNRPIPSPKGLAGTIYLVNADAEDRPIRGQVLGIEGYDAEADMFGVCSELGEHIAVARDPLERWIDSGEFIEIEHRDRLADFIEFDMDIEGETIEIEGDE